MKYYKCVEQEKVKVGHSAESKDNPTTEKAKSKQVGGVIFTPGTFENTVQRLRNDAVWNKNRGRNETLIVGFDFCVVSEWLQRTDEKHVLQWQAGESDLASIYSGMIEYLVSDLVSSLTHLN